MRTDTFVNEVTKSSAVFGRKEDIKVVFSGTQAKTNGSQITLPAIDKNSTMTEEQRMILRGYTDHEAGHVKHTDHEAVGRLGKECHEAGNKTLKSIWNCLEDVWMERRVIEDYPGAKVNLVATSDSVNGQFLQHMVENPDYANKHMNVAPVAITLEGRKDYGGTTCQPCLDLIPDDLKRQITKWVAALDHCHSTSDVIALARVVEKSIIDEDYKDEPEEREDGEDTGDGEGKSPDGEDNNDDTAEGGDDVGANEDSPDGDADDGRSSIPDTDVSAPSTGGITASDHTEADTAPYDPEMSEAITRMMDDGELTTSEDGFTYVTYDEKDEWHHRTIKSKHRDYLTQYEASDYDRVVASMAGEINSMRSKLMRSLLAQQKRDWDYGREDGRLDTRRFVQAYGGRSNVFKMRSDKAEVDTAVSILVDLSGSMGGRDKIGLAAQCVVALAESIDSTGIKYEILGFTNSGYSSGSSDIDYDRETPLHMFIFKQFEERLFEAKGAIAGIKQMALWDNSDGDAIAKAQHRLAARPESRHVMLVLSDGEPACGGHWGNIDKYTRKAVDNAAKAGTDIIGIGIVDDSVERFYPKYTVVRDLSDLAGSALDQLSRALLGDRFTVDNRKLMDVV
jgi:cobaltochelatase CobT subunit